MPLRRQLIRFCKKVHAAGLVAGTDGNLSVRLGDDRVLVTPSGWPKDGITANAIVVVSLSGQAQSHGSPTSELGLHLETYRQFPMARAAIHAHPPWAIAASINPAARFDLVPEAVVALGGITRLPYARPGTAAVKESLKDATSCLTVDEKTRHHTFLLERHGSLTWGCDLSQAFCRLESLEANAKIALLALCGGQVSPLPDAELEVMRQVPEARPLMPVRGRSRIRISDEEPLV